MKHSHNLCLSCGKEYTQPGTTYYHNDICEGCGEYKSVTKVEVNKKKEYQNEQRVDNHN